MRSRIGWLWMSLWFGGCGGPTLLDDLEVLCASGTIDVVLKDGQSDFPGAILQTEEGRALLKTLEEGDTDAREMALRHARADAVHTDFCPLEDWIAAAGRAERRAKEDADRAAASAEKKPVFEGSPEKIAIAETLWNARPRVRRCYEKQLMKDPTLAGTVEVAFDIAPDGSVPTAKATQAFHPGVDACVVKELKTLTFTLPEPRSSETISVTRPFRFGVAEDEKPAP